jgi:hypothetical protein
MRLSEARNFKTTGRSRPIIDIKVATHEHDPISGTASRITPVRFGRPRF